MEVEKEETEIEGMKTREETKHVQKHQLQERDKAKKKSRASEDEQVTKYQEAETQTNNKKQSEQYEKTLPPDIFYHNLQARCLPYASNPSHPALSI